MQTEPPAEERTPQVLERNWPDLLAFLDEWRRIRTRSLTLPGEARLVPGAHVTLRLAIPALDRAVDLSARVATVGPDGTRIEVEHAAAAALQEVEEFFQLAGRVMKSLLQSGRFRIVAPEVVAVIPGPAAPAPVPDASPAAPAMAGTPMPATGSAAGDSPSASGDGPLPGPPPPRPPAFPASATGPAAATPAAASPSAPASPSGRRMPALHDADASTRGELAGAAFRDCLMAIARDQSSGYLDVRLPDVRRLAYVQKGGPVQWVSEPLVVEDCLGVMLLRAGRLTAEQVQDSLRRMQDNGLQQGETLIEMGLLSFPTLVLALAKQAELIVRGLLSAPRGTFAFHPRERLDRRFISPPVKSAAVILEHLRGIYRDMPQAEMSATLDPLMDLYGVIDTTFPWAELRLKKPEMDLVDILKGRHYRVREMFSVSSMGRGGTISTLLPLRDLGLIQFMAREDEAQASQRITRQLNNKLDNMRKQNHFERLEIHWSARNVDVEASHDRLRREYESLDARRRLTLEQEELRQKVLAQVRESYEAIREPGARQAHRKQDYEPQQCEVSADLLFRQGEMLAVKGQWPQVVENFERAAELMPGVKRYRDGAAQARTGSYKSTASADDDG